MRPEAELHRRMGELEQNISNHQRTLEMSCKLQQALEEVLLCFLLPAQQRLHFLCVSVCV